MNFAIFQHENHKIYTLLSFLHYAHASIPYKSPCSSPLDVRSQPMISLNGKGQWKEDVLRDIYRKMDANAFSCLHGHFKAVVMCKARQGTPTTRSNCYVQCPHHHYDLLTLFFSRVSNFASYSFSVVMRLYLDQSNVEINDVCQLS